MAYTKIITIRTRGGIRNATKYIENEEKTRDRGRKTGSYNIEGAIDYVTNYAENDKKTEGKRLVTALNCTLADSAGEMKDLAAYWKQERNMQDNDRDAYHVIQSFDPSDNDKLTAEEVHKMGIEYAKRISQMDDKKAVDRKYMMIVATHTDKNHFHNHIVFCAYDIDSGKKFHECRETYKQMRAANDEICREHGLRVIENPGRGGYKGHFEDEQWKAGKSWKEDVRQDIDDTKRAVKSWEDYMRVMRKKGYEMREGKYVTYTTDEGHKVRDIRLGEQYTKAGLQDYWDHPEREREENKQTDKQENKEKEKQENKWDSRNVHDGRRELRRLMRQMDMQDTEEQRKKRAALMDQTSWYDSDGRPRTAEEMLVIMVMEMMSKGDYYGVSSIRSERPYNMQAERSDQMYMTASLMLHYGFQSMDDLNRRIDNAGKHAAVAGKEKKRAEGRLEKIEQIKTEAEEAGKYSEIINYLSSLPDGPTKEKEKEKYKAEIAEYSKHQSFLYKNGCGTEEAVQKAVNSIPETKKKVVYFTEESKKWRKEYRDLTRIRDNIEKAMNPDYVAGKRGRRTKDGQKIPGLFSLSRVQVETENGWKLHVDTNGFPNDVKQQIEQDAGRLSELHERIEQDGLTPELQTEFDTVKDRIAQAIVNTEKEINGQKERPQKQKTTEPAKPKIPGFYNLDRVRVSREGGWHLVIDTEGFTAETAEKIREESQTLQELYLKRATDVKDGKEPSEEIADEIGHLKKQMAEEIYTEEERIMETERQQEEQQEEQSEEHPEEKPSKGRRKDSDVR